ncbi:hypothetical protein [Collimonas pratensis]|uniref:hypothetical protein n=1 Tax=Collimonas pratensis TaxID=279113 RepID=UPI000AEA9094|nr:hypothetical protein [Collimonas pratensis]
MNNVPEHALETAGISLSLTLIVTPTITDLGVSREYPTKNALKSLYLEYELSRDMLVGNVRSRQTISVH